MPTESKKLYPFAIIIDHTTDDLDVSVLRFFSPYNSEADSLNAVKAVIRNYIKSHPDEGDEEEIVWDNLVTIEDAPVCFINRIPASLWGAHGFSKPADSHLFSAYTGSHKIIDEHEKYKAAPVTSKPMTRFTLVIDCDGGICCFPFLCSQETEDDAVLAVKGAVLTHFKGHPDKGDPEKLTWNDIISPSFDGADDAIIDEVPDTIWAAYGLAKDTESTTAVVSYDDPIFDEA